MALGGRGKLGLRLRLSRFRLGQDPLGPGQAGLGLAAALQGFQASRLLGRQGGGIRVRVFTQVVGEILAAGTGGLHIREARGGSLLGTGQGRLGRVLPLLGLLELRLAGLIRRGPRGMGMGLAAADGTGLAGLQVLGQMGSLGRQAPFLEVAVVVAGLLHGLLGGILLGAGGV